MSAETTIKVAAQLYEARASAKVLLGNRYADEMAKFGATLNSISLRSRRSILAVAQETATEFARDGSTDGAKLAIITMAAAVELLEPSEVAA
jgi:hypothetical protein